MRKKLSFIISLVIIFIFIPLTLYAGITIFADRKYYFISITIIVLASIPFFLSFERRKPEPREILIIAVMSAISVAGRALFIVIPGFKPVAAITAITGFSLGAEAGFLTGAISALISNMFFGQGPWTPFQMFMWGIIGFIAGLLGKTGVMHKKIPLILFGIFAGILFSFGMDIWGTMSLYGVFGLEAYIIALTSAIPFTIVYAVSNVVFLLILAKPIREKLERINNKYGTFQ